MDGVKKTMSHMFTLIFPHWRVACRITAAENISF